MDVNSPSLSTVATGSEGDNRDMFRGFSQIAKTQLQQSTTQSLDIGLGQRPELRSLGVRDQLYYIASDRRRPVDWSCVVVASPPKVGHV
jgi:hypothetical protein